MRRHALPHDTLHPGETDAVLILQQLADRPDASVAQVVDIVTVPESVLEVHIIIDRSQNIFLCDMFWDQLMYISGDRIRQLLRVLRVLLEDLTQNREVDLFCDPEASRLAVHKIRDHHVGEYFYKPFLCLDPHKRNSCILDGLSHLDRNFIAFLAENLTTERIHHILREDLVPDPVLQSQFLIKFISADLRKIISSGIKKHCCHKVFCTVQAKRLAGTDLAVQLLQTLLVVLGGIFGKACQNLRLLAKEFQDFLIRTYTERADQHSDRYLSCSIYTNVENIIGIGLVLEPCTAIGNDGAREQPLADLVMCDAIIDTG